MRDNLTNYQTQTPEGDNRALSGATFLRLEGPRNHRLGGESLVSGQIPP